MKIKVEFTVDVPRASLEALRELAGGVVTNADAAEFVRMDARDYTVGYLDTNGVAGVTVTETWERR